MDSCTCPCSVCTSMLGALIGQTIALCGLVGSEIIVVCIGVHTIASKILCVLLCGAEFSPSLLLCTAMMYHYAPFESTSKRA